MLVLEYSFGCLAQVIATLGLSWIISFTYPKNSVIQKSKYSHHISFVLSVIVESTLLGLLSIHFSLPTLLLQIFFIIKVSLGIVFIIAHFKQTTNFLKNNKTLLVSFTFLFINASIPTSSYDAFTAHFQVAKYFIEQSGYPMRPDFQYLDALPLGIHMLFLAPMSLKLEGCLNILPAIFTIYLFHLLILSYGKRIGLFSVLILISMPEFIRISMDPMVDTPSIYFAIFGFIAITRMHSSKIFFALSIAAINWSFLMTIKPTMAFFIILYFAIAVFALLKRKIKFAQLVLLCAMTLPGALWFYKAWLLHSNPLYPYFFSPNTGVLFPEHLKATSGSLVFSFIHYLKIIFLDSRYFLSIGPWPLAFIPLILFRKKYSPKIILALILFIGGLLLTFKFTSFKNRYFLPYLCILVPWFALILNNSSRYINILFTLWCFLNISLYIPYIAQPLLVILKGHTKESYYSEKFDNYSIISDLNKLPEGKTLFVATPVYWLERDHVVSIYSETYIDYTRLNSNELIQKIKDLNIKYVYLDKVFLRGMINHKLSHYRKNAYCAKKCLDLMNITLKNPEFKIITNHDDYTIAEITSHP